MGLEQDYIDEELGWHIQIKENGNTVNYIYINQKTEDMIRGSASKSTFQPPRNQILSFIREKQELRKLEEAGLLREQIARRIMYMVHKLHQNGFESLYLDSVMSASGGFWRYEIGAMKDGLWPNGFCRTSEINDLCVKDSIGGGFNQKIPWATITDSVDILADKFVKVYPIMVRAARKPNLEYVTWYRKMLEFTKPEGMLIFWCDPGPDHEYAFTWGSSIGFKIPMPPGYRKINA